MVGQLKLQDIYDGVEAKKETIRVNSYIDVKRKNIL